MANFFGVGWGFPVGKEKVPVGKELAPLAKEQPLVGKDQAPVGTEQPLVGKELAPLAKEKAVNRFALAEYEDSIRQSIRIILSTAKGERVMRPDFGCGIHELVFAPNSAATRGMAESHVSKALLLWEPRIEVLEVRARAAGAQEEELEISIAYRVLSSDSRFNLVYPFYLERGSR
jgi:phage baseplate assembly protein W